MTDKSRFDLLNEMSNLQHELDYLSKIIVQDLAEEKEIVGLCISVRDKESKAVKSFIGDVSVAVPRVINYQIPYSREQLIKMVTEVFRDKENKLMELDKQLKKQYTK